MRRRPSDSLTMTCEQYSDLDADTQLAVIDAILAQEGSVLGPQNAEIAKTLADAVCQFLPAKHGQRDPAWRRPAVDALAFRSMGDTFREP